MREVNTMVGYNEGSVPHESECLGGTMGLKATPPITRILPKLVYEDRGFGTACWIYTGRLHEYGYGMVSYKNKPLRVHRVTYEHFVGPIPKGLDIDHLCRVRECCNPEHLEPVTRSENLRRGDGPRLTRERASAIVRCPHGHEYTYENTGYYTTPKGHTGRLCKECRRLRNAKRQSQRH